jgi:hypothetical protein
VLRRLLKRLEAACAAVAFAEEGEVESARQVLAADDRGGTPGSRPARRPARRVDLPRERIARLP